MTPHLSFEVELWLETDVLSQRSQNVRVYFVLLGLLMECLIDF